MTTKHEKTPAEMTAEKVQDKSVQKDAATEMAKEAVKDQIALDTGTTPKEEDQTPSRYQLEGTNLIESYLSMGLKELEKAIDPKGEPALGDDVVERILILERNGPNRTEQVKLLCKRLGFKPKDIFKELPQAGGPDTTNDVSALSDL